MVPVGVILRFRYVEVVPRCWHDIAILTILAHIVAVHTDHYKMKTEPVESKPREKLPTKRPTKVRIPLFSISCSWEANTTEYPRSGLLTLLLLGSPESQKKPKDKPKRPLSAYNFFFKEEREKILKVVLAEDPSTVQDDPKSDEFLSDEIIGRLKKEGGKVSFEEMGK